MKKVTKKTLIIVMLILIFAVIMTDLTSKRVKSDNYAVKYNAALIMQEYMDEIKEYKLNSNIGISKEDLNNTGLIGEYYTDITTTLGAIEAKRTVANSDMAALMVEMMQKAGIKEGDCVGASFSGSFPGMNLATIAACKAMNVNLLITASIGASQYGANQTDLTFIDMLHILNIDPIAISMGGDYDCGYEMFEDAAYEVKKRALNYGYNFIYIPDYEENISYRMRVFEENGPIKYMIAVGGNTTAIGKGEDILPPGIVEPYFIKKLDQNSGLLQRYNYDGMTVLHILNIKKIVADYGLPYDPDTLLQIGQSDIYYETKYNLLYPIFGILISGYILLKCRLKRQ